MSLGAISTRSSSQCDFDIFFVYFYAYICFCFGWCLLSRPVIAWLYNVPGSPSPFFVTPESVFLFELYSSVSCQCSPSCFFLFLVSWFNSVLVLIYPFTLNCVTCLTTFLPAILDLPDRLLMNTEKKWRHDGTLSLYTTNIRMKWKEQIQLTIQLDFNILSGETRLQF